MMVLVLPNLAASISVAISFVINDKVIVFAQFLPFLVLIEVNLLEHSHLLSSLFEIRKD